MVSTQYDPVRLVEAVLFASAEPLSLRMIEDRLPPGVNAGPALRALEKLYEGRGVTLENRDGFWAFRTAADLGEALQFQKQQQKKLSRAAMETLAVIAYHQPVTRVEIENIRGVATNKGTLDQLLEVEWIRPGRRRETPGRPLTWVTTPVFLDHFGIESLNDLPGLDDLKAAGLLDRRPAIETVPRTGELFETSEENEEE